MNRREKLIDKIRARPSEANFADVQLLLEIFGWHVDRVVGSHSHFVKNGEFPLSIPTVHGRKVKRVYLDEICNRLNLD